MLVIRISDSQATVVFGSPDDVDDPILKTFVACPTCSVTAGFLVRAGCSMSKHTSGCNVM